jgi:hypothetical protein
MPHPGSRAAEPFWHSLWVVLVVLAVAVACDDKPPTQPSPQPQPQPQPTPTVTAGRIVQSPAGIGLVLATTFTFTAENFSASNGAALTYTWDFGDGGRQTGGASITHAYSGTGVFAVTVSAATAAGASATATLRDVAATTIDGRWGLQDATGRLIMASTALSQNGLSVSGDDTRLNCRFAVSGTLEPQRGIRLTYVRGRNDCQGLDVPVMVTFTGIAEEAAGGFLGTLDTGLPARLFVCRRPGCD